MTTITYKLSKKEYFKEYIKAFLPSFAAKFFLIVFILDLGRYVATGGIDAQIWIGRIFVITIYVFYALIEALPASIVFLISLILIFWIKLNKNSSLNNNEFTFGYSQEKLIFETKTIKSEIKWDAVKKAKINNGFYLLYLSNSASSHMFIPKKAFTDEQKMEFKKILQEKQLT